MFDLASLRRNARAKLVAGLAALGMVGYATAMVCLSPNRVDLPDWATWSGWVLMPVSLFLLIYSLFIDLPPRKTYVEPGVGEELVKTGTYALVRHPGVLWYLLFLISLLLISGAKLMLIAAPVWFFMDVLYVTVQDKFLFGKMFHGYEDYRQETPMLVPSRKSIGACFRTLRLSKAQVQGRRG